MTIIAAIIAIPIFNLTFVHNPLDGTQFSGILDMLLNIVPADAISPLMEGNSPQLILMAFVLGNAIIIAGSQAYIITNFIGQANSIGLIITDWVSRMTPYFVFILLILEIWNGSVMMFLGIIQPLVVFLVICIVALICIIGYICIKNKVEFWVIVSKIMPSFMTALKTASVNSAYGENIICCEKRLGIHKSLTSYALPLGLLMYMPAGSISSLMFTLYMASVYGVSVSIIWYVIAISLTVMLFIAAPPVSGVSLLAYAAIFSQLGIPSEALAVAMVADIIFSFFYSAIDQAMLQLELVLQADYMGFLDTKILCTKLKK